MANTEELEVKTGLPITKEQRDLFQKVLSIDDLIDLSTKSKVSYSTFRSLFYRKGNVTDENKEAVTMMISKSLEKVQDAIIYYKKAESTLVQMQNLIHKEG